MVHLSHHIMYHLTTYTTKLPYFHNTNINSIPPNCNKLTMSEAVDLSMSFDDDDNVGAAPFSQNSARSSQFSQRSSSPHNTKETAIAIDDSSDDDDEGKKPAGSPSTATSYDPASGSPVRNQSSYRLYTDANRQTVKDNNPGMGFMELTQLSSKQFTELSTEERKIWDDKAAKDKARYNNELAAYNKYQSERAMGIGLKPSPSFKRVKPEPTSASKYAASRKVSMSPTPNNNSNTTNSAMSSMAARLAQMNSNKPYGCSHCSQRFNTFRKKHRHEVKCKKKKVKAERGRGGRKVKAEQKKPNAGKEGEDGEDVEEADEITYNSYVPKKVKFGKDHPDKVVENATLSAVDPPDVTYNLAMPASILSEGKLSNLQLEAIIYGCQRHMVDLPVKPVEDLQGDMMGEEPLVEKPLRAGFLLGDGAGKSAFVLFIMCLIVFCEPHVLINFTTPLFHHEHMKRASSRNG